MLCLIHDVDRELLLTGRQTQVALREARGRPPQVVCLPRKEHIYSMMTPLFQNAPTIASELRERAIQYVDI